MKKIYRLLMSVVAVAGTLACTTDATEDLGVKVGGTTQLTLSLDSSRTQLGEKDANGLYPLTWSEKDQITVNGVTSDPLATEDGAGTANATFTFGGALTTPYFVAYPAADAANQVKFAATQYYSSNTSFESGVATMCGYSENGVGVKLQHLTGVLKIGISKGEATIKSVRISTADRQPIAGTFNAAYNAEDGKFTFTPAETSEIITYYFDQYDESGDGLDLSMAEGTTYIYVAVPVVNDVVYNELYVTLTDKDGGVMYATVKAPATKPLKAGAVREFSSDITYAAISDSDAFVIDSYAALDRFKLAVQAGSNLDAVVVADIDVETASATEGVWKSINAPNYTGEFNGNGYAISGLKAPLFDTVAATIKGVHLRNVNITSTSSTNVGALVNTYMGSSITHCSTSGAITLARETSIANKIGGLVGSVSNFTTDWEVSNCVNNCAITVTLTKAATSAAAMVGGIMADSYTDTATGTTATLANNTNNGAISVSGSTAALVGVSGVVARLNSCTPVLTNCENTKAVSAELSTSVEFHVSGILGRHVGVEGSNLTAIDCSNSGKISANLTGSNTSTVYSSVAGCFGYLANTKGGLLTIDNCDNSGDIDVDATTSLANQLHIGALAGCLYALLDVQNCENTGTEVSFNGNGLSHRFCIGGLVGRAAMQNANDTTNANGKNIVNFKTCTNAADITLTDGGTISNQVFVGGVIALTYGYSSQYATFTYDDLDNNGNITLSSKNWTYSSDASSSDALDVPRAMVGGIIGSNWIEDSSSSGSNYSSFCVTNCNNGDEKSVNTKKILISGTKNYSVSVGGIIGVHSYGTPKSNAATYPSKLDTCKNYMTVEHSATTASTTQIYLAGICGMYTSVQRYQRGCFHNCSNYGNINAYAANTESGVNVSVSGVLGVQRNHRQKTGSIKRTPIGVTMENVYNKGTINVGGTTGFTCTQLCVGGLVGEAELLAYTETGVDTATLNNYTYNLTDVANVGNINVSNITGSHYIGGAIGYNKRVNGSRTYSNIKAHCTITVSEGYNAGMLAGFTPTSNLKFSACEVGGTLVKGTTSTTLDAENVTQYSFGPTTEPNASYASVSFLTAAPVVK